MFYCVYSAFLIEIISKYIAMLKKPKPQISIFFTFTMWMKCVIENMSGVE